MWRRAIAAGILGAALSGYPVQACGDKFLLVGKGALFPRGYRAAHPASVLIYLPNAAGQRNPGRDIASLLRRAGHTAAVVTTRRALDDALASDHIDIVLGSPSSISAFATSPGAGAGPIMVPVLPNPKPEEIAAAARRYGFVVNGQEPVRQFLHTIDDAMDSRTAIDGGSR